MKAVLMAFHPKRCEKIFSGEKTVDVRNVAPKLKTPYKAYVYETQGATETPWVDEDGALLLLDECGKFEYCPSDRFEIVAEARLEELKEDI